MLENFQCNVVSLQALIRDGPGGHKHANIDGGKVSTIGQVFHLKLRWPEVCVVKKFSCVWIAVEFGTILIVNGAQFLISAHERSEHEGSLGIFLRNQSLCSGFHHVIHILQCINSELFQGFEERLQNYG